MKSNIINLEKEKSENIDDLGIDQESVNYPIEKFNILGESQAVVNSRYNISVCGKFDAPVLITGETGTGKELAARGMHYGGKRSNRPFIAVNCATLTNDLFLSELFGHKKGAFTDAKKDKKGLLSIANQGTLFLDEIDSLSLNSQAALLRFLQESEYRPVGSEEVLNSNVRIIASANCDLEKRIEAGAFRRDLYYRLYIFHIHMPALRDRKSDIILLANHFINKFSQQYNMGDKFISEELVAHLMERSWQGNVRELENMMHRLYLLSHGDVIDICHTESAFKKCGDQEESLDGNNQSIEMPGACDIDDCSDLASSEDEYTTSKGYDFSRDKKNAVESFERQYVTKVLKVSRGNVTRAANLCGKERRAFGKLVKKYKIEKISEI